jgi:hypothetical protein
MRRKFRSTIGAAVIIAIVAGLIVTTIGPAFAAAPPWEPDPNAAAPYGRIVFYDAGGNVLTGGNNLSHIADYAAASTAKDTGATLATLYFSAPDHTKVTGLWNVGQASSSTAFPNASAPAPVTGPGFANPLVTLGASDGDLTSYLGGVALDSTAGYANIIQVRLKDSGPGGAGSGSHYWETDISYDSAAGTWAVIDPSMTATTTTISTTPANGGNTTSGNNVTMTATVSPSSAANGTVQFFDGATAVGSPQAVSTGSPTTPVVTDTAPADGVHHYTAKFTPTGGTFSVGSTSAQSVVSIGPPPVATQTALAASPTTANQGDPVTFTATVTAGSPAGSVTPPTGTVTFKDNGTTIGTDNTESAPGSGVYSIVVSTLTVGVHNNITADFAPTGNFSPSTGGPITVTINPAASCSLPGSNCSDTQNVQVTVNAGSLVISTPYTSTNPFILPAMTLNADGTLLSTSAQFPDTAHGAQPIRVVSTLAGDPGWTASVSATALNTSPSNATPIDPRALGLTGLNLISGPAGKTAPTFTDNPAHDWTSSDTNQGLAPPPHVFAQKTSDGNGTWNMYGTLTLLAPSTTLPGTYFGTITFTVV